MINFEHVSARSEAEALELLGPNGSSSLIAGGTDLLVLIKEGIAQPQRVIDIKGLGTLRGITPDGGALRLGALTTLTEIEESDQLRQGYTVLAEAAALAASPQLRNQATLGGNLLQRPRCWYFRGDYNCWLKGGDICYAVQGENHHHAILGSRPCIAVQPSDLAPALVALDASLQLRGTDGERELTVEAFFRNPTEDRRIEHELGQGELITAITLPQQPEGARSTYLKAMEREAWAYALVGVEARLVVRDGTVEDARVVLGGVATTPWRATSAEEALRGQEASEETFQRAAAAAVEGAHPYDDNGYKVTLARNLVRRALSRLA